MKGVFWNEDLVNLPDNSEDNLTDISSTNKEEDEQSSLNLINQQKVVMTNPQAVIAIKINIIDLVDKEKYLVLEHRCQGDV